MTRMSSPRAAPTADSVGSPPLRRPSMSHALALWLALALTFSPVIVEWIEDWPNLFSAGSLLLPIAMLIRLATSVRPPAASWGRSTGVALVFLGVIAELFGISVGAWSIARVGLALAVTGMLMWLHRWSFAAAAIALGCVPVPAFAALVTTPTFEVAYGTVAAGLLDRIGLGVPMIGPLVGSGSSVLELQPAYNGLHASWLLALIGWYAGVRRLGTGWQALRRAAIGALLGPPIQFVATVVAIALVAAGYAGVGRSWMEQGLWIAIAIAGIAWVEIPLRANNVETGPVDGEA
jgi:hypothetical protein